MQGFVVAAALAVACTPSAGEGPLLIGRILDERGEPWANAPIQLEVERMRRKEDRWETDRRDEQDARTDDAGRFSLPLKAEWKTGTRLFLRFERSLAVEPWHALGEATLELTEAAGGSTIELGGIILPSFPPAPWTGMTDDALLRRIETSGARWRTLNRDRREWESTLLEAARRGGAVMEKALTRELAAIRDPAVAKRYVDGELQALIALRRAQRKPEPLELLCLSERAVEVTWPDSPTFAFELVNRDVGGESFRVTDGGSYRSGRFARVAVEGHDATGASLPERPWMSMMGGGVSTHRQLAPTTGTSKVAGPRFAVPIDNYVSFSGPGDFALRILLHDTVTIADESAAGYVVTTSPELTVRLRPLVIEFTSAELDEIRGWVKAIDATKTVPTIARPWRADLEFVGEPTDAQDRLFRTGLRSLPALVEALDDDRLTPVHLGWILGLLAAITGHGRESFPGAGLGGMELGNTTSRVNWPTTKEGVAEGAGGYGGSTGEPWPDRQKTAAEEWRGLKRCFEVRVREAPAGDPPPSDR